MNTLTKPGIRLYTYAMSPYAAKVHCFLRYKGLGFEPFYINPLTVPRALPRGEKVGRTIPVLTIDDESRGDSTPIGLWLDERFPERPLLPPADGTAEQARERDRLLECDRWISDEMIPASFRLYPGDGLERLLGGWRLGWVMHRTARGGIPWYLRAAWPLVVTTVPFARRLRRLADDGLPIPVSKLRIYDAFLERLEGGPFLLGRSEPSLPDLAAYPQFALFWLAGFRGGDRVRERPVLVEWMKRVQASLCDGPPLLPAAVQRRELP